MAAAVAAAVHGWLRGSRVRALTYTGEAIEGDVYAFDQDTTCLVLRQRTTTNATDPNVFDYRVVKTSFLESLEVLSKGPPAAAMPDPSYVNIEELHRKEDKAVRAAYNAVQNVGDNVSAEAQAIFNALTKTMPCRWQHQDILVMQCVITQPYTAAQCRLVPDRPNTKDREALERVKMVLGQERSKLGLA